MHSIFSFVQFFAADLFFFCEMVFFCCCCLFWKQKKKREKKLFQFIWIIWKWNLWELNIIWRMSRFYKKRCIQDIWWIFFSFFVFVWFHNSRLDTGQYMISKKKKQTNSQCLRISNFPLSKNSTNFVWFFSFLFLTMQFDTSSSIVGNNWILNPLKFIFIFIREVFSVRRFIFLRIANYLKYKVEFHVDWNDISLNILLTHEKNAIHLVYAH